MKQTKDFIPVKNAGLVILGAYFPMLFERAALMTNHRLTEPEKAAHYLQFVATGLVGTADSLLPLNKILCGISLQHPIAETIDVPATHRELITGMINTAIANWPGVGSSTVDGFRGNWLLRDGLLTERSDRWELTVEKRAYDLLLHKSPFSFSIINHPWMKKPLHVSWPY